MFSVGEYVVCGGRAVCRVEAVGPLRFRRGDGEAYYTLCPPFADDGERLYVPVDTTLPIRRVVTEEEALQALSGLRTAGEEPLGTANQTMLQQRYKAMLASGDMEEELRLFRTLYRKERGLRGGRRRLTQVDVIYYKLVERLLCDELSLALGETAERAAEQLRAAAEGKPG